MLINNNDFYITTANTPSFYDEWRKYLTGDLHISNDYNYPKVEKIIYNFKNPEKPATVCFWGDGTKTVVVCNKEDFNKESGLAQCFLKKCLDCSRRDIQKLINNADIQE